MTIKVHANRIGIAPRKVRGVINLIRNKKASEALRVLRFCEKKEIAIVLSKLLNSGLSIAQESDKIDIDNLVVSTIYANGGQTQKRIQPRAQGRAFRIRKRSSHITLELKEA
jgi:large subunit ribosomal protein L22